MPLLFRLSVNPVLDIIQKTTPFNIEISKPRMVTSVIPNIAFKADLIDVSDKNNQKLLECSKLKFNIRILPLIAGKLHINYIKSDDIFLNLNLKDKLYFGDYKINLDNEPVKLSLNKLKINKINILVNDKNQNYKFIGNKYLFINKKNHIVAKGKSKFINQNISSNIDLDVDLSKKSGNFKKNKLDLIIENFDLKSITPILSAYVDNMDFAEGIINIISSDNKLNAEFKNIKVIDKRKYHSIIFPDIVNIISKYKIKKDTFRLSDLKVLANGIDVTCAGTIDKIYSKNPKFNLETKINDIDIRKGALMLPNIITEDINIPKLKEYPFYGNISGKIKIKGELPEPDIIGNINAKNGVLVKPIPNTKEGARADIGFTGRKMLLDIYVPAGNREFVYVNGDVLLYDDRYTNLKIRSSKSVSLASAEAVVNPLHKILCFLIGPVPIMDITGLGNINIEVSGTKKQPHIWGEFNFYNTNARFFDVNNMVLKNASGNIKFNNQDVYFINKKGTLNGQNLNIDGIANLQGNLDFKAITNNQNLSDLIKILTTSPMLESLQNIIPQFDDVQGKSDFYLNITGKLLNLEDLNINENIFFKGYIKLKNDSLKYEKVPIKNISGIINYDAKDFDINIKSIICSGSFAKIKGTIKNNICNLAIDAPKICINDFDRTKLNYLDNLFIKLNAKYNGTIDKIQPQGINATIEILKDNKPVKIGKILSGKIVLKNSNLQVNNFRGIIKNNPFKLELNAKNIGNNELNLNKANINGRFICKDFELSAINYLKKIKVLPPNIQKEVDKINIVGGNSDVDIKIRNNKPDAVLNLNTVIFEYSILEGPKKILVKVPIKLINGKLTLKNNILYLDKFNCLIDNMPLLLYCKVTNIYKNPKCNIHINSKLMQKVFDKYWNANNIYPVKMNGDILFSTLINGTKSNADIKTDIKMEKNSSLYYMGATFGDNLNPVTINVDANIDKSRKIKLNKLNYNKLVSSQNNRQNTLPLLTIKGEIQPKGKIFALHNFSIKTENPTDAKFFNIIFKKPTIKNGNFTSNILLNGESNNLKIRGEFKANNIDMPYLNTVIKDLSINFKPDYIYTTTRGEIFSNYIMINSKMKNSLSIPYRISGADIYINDFDINHSINLLKQLELKGISSAISPNTTSDSIDLLNSLIIDNLKIRAGIIHVKNIKAANLEADCSLNEKMQLAVKSFKLNMANGLITGNLNYNLLNNYMKMGLNAKDVNANALTIALFDLPNQIHGSLSGNIEMSCNASSDRTRLETLNASGAFSVTNGRMPKLGSLEYLLKAGNLLKGGITNLSMNGIIDIITPMKTGEFSSIKGRLSIKDGIMNTIEIQTLGKDLNLYMTGKFNFHSQIADMRVFGQISRRISTILGAAGNISLNTLFNKIPGISLSADSSFINDVNKIPGIELRNKISRKFIVEILGDINGENFVKSFNWLN